MEIKEGYEKEYEELMKELEEAKEDKEKIRECDEKTKQVFTEEEIETIKSSTVFEVWHSDKELFEKLFENSVELFSINYYEPYSNLNRVTFSINYILNHYFVMLYQTNAALDYDRFQYDITNFEEGIEEIKKAIELDFVE